MLNGFHQALLLAIFATHGATVEAFKQTSVSLNPGLADTDALLSIPGVEIPGVETGVDQYLVSLLRRIRNERGHHRDAIIDQHLDALLRRIRNEPGRVNEVNNEVGVSALMLAVLAGDFAVVSELLAIPGVDKGDVGSAVDLYHAALEAGGGIDYKATIDMYNRLRPAETNRNAAESDFIFEEEEEDVEDVCQCEEVVEECVGDGTLTNYQMNETDQCDEDMTGCIAVCAILHPASYLRHDKLRSSSIESPSLFELFECPPSTLSPSRWHGVAHVRVFNRQEWLMDTFGSTADIAEVQTLSEAGRKLRVYFDQGSLFAKNEFASGAFRNVIHGLCVIESRMFVPMDMWDHHPQKTAREFLEGHTSMLQTKMWTDMWATIREDIHTDMLKTLTSNAANRQIYTNISKMTRVESTQRLWLHMRGSFACDDFRRSEGEISQALVIALRDIVPNDEVHVVEYKTPNLTSCTNDVSANYVSVLMHRRATDFDDADANKSAHELNRSSLVEFELNVVRWQPADPHEGSAYHAFTNLNSTLGNLDLKLNKGRQWSRRVGARVEGHVLRQDTRSSMSLFVAHTIVGRWSMEFLSLMSSIVTLCVCLIAVHRNQLHRQIRFICFFICVVAVDAAQASLYWTGTFVSVVAVGTQLLRYYSSTLSHTDFFAAKGFSQSVDFLSLGFGVCVNLIDTLDMEEIPTFCYIYEIAIFCYVMNVVGPCLYSSLAPRVCKVSFAVASGVSILSFASFGSALKMGAAGQLFYLPFTNIAALHCASHLLSKDMVSTLNWVQIIGHSIPILRAAIQNPLFVLVFRHVTVSTEAPGLEIIALVLFYFPVISWSMSIGFFGLFVTCPRLKNDEARAAAAKKMRLAADEAHCEATEKRKEKGVSRRSEKVDRREEAKLQRKTAKAKQASRSEAEEKVEPKALAEKARVARLLEAEAKNAAPSEEVEEVGAPVQVDVEETARLNFETTQSPAQAHAEEELAQSLGAFSKVDDAKAQDEAKERAWLKERAEAEKAARLAEAKARAQAEELAQLKARAEVEKKVRLAEAKARARAEELARSKARAEAEKAARLAEAKVRAHAEELAQLKAQAEAEKKARLSEAKARAQAEELARSKAQADAEKAARLADAKARKEAEELAQLKSRAETEKKARLAEAKARADAEKALLSLEAEAVVNAKAADELRQRLEDEKLATEEAAAALAASTAPSPAAKSDGSEKRSDGDPRLVAFLASCGQEHVLPLFVKEAVDLDTLEVCPTLKELMDLLESLGLTLGSRKKIARAIQSSSAAAKSFAIDKLNAQVEEGALHQERLEAELSAHRAEVAKLRAAMQQCGGVPREFECPIRYQRASHQSSCTVTSRLIVVNMHIAPVLSRSFEIMMQPTIAADGHTYEKAAIVEWLSTSSTSPITNKVIDPSIMIPNHLVNSQIQDFLSSCRKRDDA
jgi:hypothetical protein